MAASAGLLAEAHANMAVPAGAAGESMEEAHARLVETFGTGRTRSYKWRAAQLSGLRRMLTENSAAAAEALCADLGRPENEALAAEVFVAVGEIDHMLKSLKKWMAPEKRPTPLLQKPARSVVVREPKGVVLDITCWNFPISLSVASMAAVIAAGNCCLLKPSEVSPACQEFLKEYIPRYMDADAVAVVTGGVAETKRLLKLRWDHIMYTGNLRVAREIKAAAAQHMTPCTMELGGKCPALVLPGASMSVAVQRLCAGKFLNAGQICTSPDYALVHESVAEAFEAKMKETLLAWYGEDARQSASFGRIVNQRHFQRLQALVASAGEAEVHQMGQMDEASGFVPPTLVKNPGEQTALMNEEVFGPVLPYIICGTVDEMVERVNAKEKPLALYVFGKEADAREVIEQTSSGGVCVNDTLVHAASAELPFGGVGQSGMGFYHGKWGFDEFSHLRGVMYRASWIDSDLRYPPYTEGKLKTLETLMIKGILPQKPVPRALVLGSAGLVFLALLLMLLWVAAVRPLGAAVCRDQ